MDLSQQLSPHFTLGELIQSETATRRGLDNTPSPAIVANLTRLAATLEQVRAAVGNRPVVVTSGYRSLAVNRAVGSLDTSAHVQGLAADLHVPGMTVLEVAHAIVAARVPFDQCIDEKSWLHVGLAAGRLRGQVLTAIFTPGVPTRYVVGIG
jgi:hypothetical protein